MSSLSLNEKSRRRVAKVLPVRRGEAALGGVGASLGAVGAAVGGVGAAVPGPGARVGAKSGEVASWGVGMSTRSSSMSSCSLSSSIVSSDSLENSSESSRILQISAGVNRRRAMAQSVMEEKIQLKTKKSSGDIWHLNLRMIVVTWCNTFPLACVNMIYP